MAHFLDQGGGFFAGELEAFEALVLLRDGFHGVLDFNEVVGSELMIEIEVVVEAAVGRRADVELGLRENTEDSSGKDVRG